MGSRGIGGMSGAVKSVFGVAFLAGVGAFLVVLLLVPVGPNRQVGSTFRVPTPGRSEHHFRMRLLLSQGEYLAAADLGRQWLPNDPQDTVNLILLGQTLDGLARGVVREEPEGLLGAGFEEDEALVEAQRASRAAELTWIWSMLREQTAQRAELRPTDAEAQYHHAFALWGLGERLAAREVWLRAAELTRSMSRGPMSGDYNRACCLALAGERSAALEALRASAEYERIDPAWVRADPDLWPLHGETEFWSLVERYEAVWRQRSGPETPSDEDQTPEDTSGHGLTEPEIQT